MAASKLYDGGFKKLGWLAGGFNRSADSDFPAVEGSEKLRYATIGAASEKTPAENTIKQDQQALHHLQFFIAENNFCKITYKAFRKNQ
ncbi:unnamed protein product [Dovyalis caffra]|uniref:Uncharacterized protein n=1 Tax=Dovyalis caffra TaxID=77055 RepID=A0AAV1S255_9ROSI|nr:unnamed protein product [Dovyalis caffra]